MKDYYKILGVNKNSSHDDIKMAYKKLAMKYHPDRNPNDSKCEEKFKDIKEAYENLINKDRISFNNSNNFNNFSSSESSLDDIFNIIFQRNFKKDLNKNFFYLDVDLEWCVYGSFFKVRIPTSFNCEKCLGKGVRPGSNFKICSKCTGSGFYTIVQGFFTFKQKCLKCNGKGNINSDFCIKCKGSGKFEDIAICSARIEKSSDNDSKIFLDFKSISDKTFLENTLLFVKIKTHPLFIRNDPKSNDISYNFYIDFLKSVFGGYIKVFTIYGFILYNISKYTQNSKILKIQSFGLDFNKKIGDLYLNILIEVISNLNVDQHFLFYKIKLHSNLYSNYNIIFNINNYIKNFYNLVLNFK